MNYEVEVDGTIVTKKTKREAELLYQAVQSKHMNLRHDPMNEGKCRRLMELQVQLNAAILESNKARMEFLVNNLKYKAERESASVFRPEKTTLWRKIINFFDNPFCTHDYEWAHTRCGAKFTIDGMVFSSKLYPSEVYGTVETEDGEMQVTWNDRGRCSSKQVKDVHCYDLIRQNQGQRDSGLITGIAFLCILFLFIIFLLNL